MISAVQEVIFAKVSGIPSLGADVYGYVPNSQDADISAPYPYVVVQAMITEDASTQGETECFTATFDIDVWDNAKSTLPVAAIQKKIYDALHLATDLAPTGYGVSIVRQTNSNIFLDPDGITHHGLQTFEIAFEVPTNYTY